MKALLISFFSVSLVFSGYAFADELKLKDGQVIVGKFISRDANEVVFEIAGQQLKFPSNNVQGISFGDAPVVPTTEPVKKEQATLAPAVKPENKTVMVPAGTRIVVRTGMTLNTKQHSKGHKFTARLEADLVLNSVVVAPRGSTLYGVVTAAKKSGRLVGKATMELGFTDIMINNQMISISTSAVRAITEATGKKTVGTTARAAAIGGLINGSDGAKDGAKIGLGVSLLTRGNDINIPVGTMLEFQLTAPFTRP
jgi:hypothetical protein